MKTTSQVREAEAEAGRRRFLKLCTASVGILSSGVTISAEPIAHGGRRHAEITRLAAQGAKIAADPPGTHNMLVVGEQTVFLSHLPMFGKLKSGDFTAVHRYQVILEATFADGGNNVQDLYARDRKNNPGIKIYTLQPEEFVLTELFMPEREPPSRTSFKAAVYRGHLERIPQPPKPIEELKNIDVNVKRVVHARKFDPADSKPDKLEYILFGRGPELFLAHRISLPPDFDQMLSVRVDNPPFSDDELSRGISVVFPDRSNSSVQRIKATEKVVGRGHVPGAHQFLTLNMLADKEFYFEESELFLPPDFGQTPEEKKAGMPA